VETYRPTTGRPAVPSSDRSVRAQGYSRFIFPVVLRTLFWSYPESCRFFMYISWSLLLKPGAAACAFIGWFGYIAADALEFIEPTTKMRGIE